ncbi:uncharacterized protein LOC143179836 [Calliopsis andreniformis]|uniref:uncharacterized protein LOC143179836 n=1 Tax=Calliopsis andreniformis TaxID=337506 RepID=UPI003FCD7445
MDLKYNYFFYANACHICKCFGQGVCLKRCGNCMMIAYCSKVHQKEHWSQHKDLCNAICNVLKDNKMSSFLNDTVNLCAEEWSQMKMNFMLLVALKISRKLEYYEEQMFKFLRSCTVCHNMNSKVLVDCPACPNISFCTKHKNDEKHNKLCFLLKSCFILDLAAIKYERKTPEFQIPNCINYVNLPTNIKDFIDCYIKSEPILHLSREEEIMINTEHLTRPLTFLYAIQKLRYLSRDENIVIHIIAANMVEINGIELWEILLHWLPNITVATIVLIGPELLSGSISLQLCENCRSSNKQFLIQMHGTVYHNYVHSNLHIKPNFIIGYNAGIHEYEDSKNDTWLQSLHLINKQNCPLILTSYTQSEAEKEKMKINRILNSNVKCICSEENPYSSWRPYRDFETEGIYYQNQCIIIYKNLMHNKCC